MLLSFIDWVIIIAFFAISLGIGVYASRSSGKNAKNFFLSGRNMSWWLLGISMVATTFAADTPGLVAGIVRNDGVYGNWVWWSFLLTGMLTVFFYSKLWRKSEISTDLEFYELRYSGKSAAFLRGFRAIYLGVFFNIVIMATVCLAAIKIGHVMFNFSAVESLVISCSVTVLYSMLGGLKGVILTDFIQFAIAITGSIWATIYIVEMPEIDGLQELLAVPEVNEKSSIFPDFSNPKIFIPILVVPLAVQWWSVWYPGAEPGGGGYIVQRMLAARNTKHATLATLLFTVVHYAIRPWPWIIIGLASIVLFPDLQSLALAFPDLNEDLIKNDLAYAAMLSYLPAGLLGLVVTSLIAAFMSTISTHLNWGSSYVVNDFYVRFLRPKASESNKVLVGRLSTLFMMIFAGLLALVLEEAKEAFDLLLQIGAGTGLLFILRWFWYKINPYSEIAAMLSSFIIAVIFFVGKTYGIWQLESHIELVFGVLITTCIWVGVTLLTKPSPKETIDSFEKKVFDNGQKFDGFKYKIIGFIAGVAGVYSALFATGYLIYNEMTLFILSASICFISIAVIIYFWKKIIN